MKKLLLILLAAALAVGLILIVGCSDDDEETTQPVVKQTGDPNAEEFEATGEAFGFVEMLNQEMFYFMFETIDTVMNSGFIAAPKGGFTEFATGAASDTVILTYHSGSKYWYLYAQAVDSETVNQEIVTLTMTVIDSVQFLHSGTPVQWPDSALLTGVKNGVSLSIDLSDSTAMVDAHQLITVTGDLPGFGDVEVDGNSSFDVFVSMDDVSQSCTFDINLTASLTDIMMNLTNMDAGGCPSSGRASYGGMINLACVGDTTFTFNDNWTVVQTFDGTTIHYVVENSTHRWEFDDPCGVVTAPENRVTEFLDRLR